MDLFSTYLLQWLSHSTQQTAVLAGSGEGVRSGKQQPLVWLSDIHAEWFAHVDSGFE